MYSGTNLGTKTISIHHTEPYSQRRVHNSWKTIFAKADPIAVDITATEVSIDGFINNIITIKVDDKYLLDLAKSKALLVIYTLF